MKTKILIAAIFTIGTTLLLAKPQTPFTGEINNPDLVSGVSDSLDEGIIFTRDSIFDDDDQQSMNQNPDIGVDEVENKAGFLDDFSLFPHGDFQLGIHPNPFTSHTTIEFTLPISSLVSMDVFDLSGRRFKKLFLKEFQKGKHFIYWNSEELEGIYFIRLKTNVATLVQKAIILK